MNRETLLSILQDAPGVTINGDDVTADPERGLNLYVGQPGQAMVIRDVSEMRLTENYISASTRDGKATFYVSCDEVHALSTVPPKDKSERRAGFA